MKANPRKAGVCLVGLLAASLVVVAQQGTLAKAHGQNAPREARPDVGAVRGIIVYSSGSGSDARPDAGSDVWVFAGKLQFPSDCTIFTSSSALTIGECAPRNRSVPFLKHAQANGSGSFEIGSLPPGEYTLAIRSAHVGGTDKRDTGNRFAFSWFSIKGGDTVEANTKF